MWQIEGSGGRPTTEADEGVSEKIDLPDNTYTIRGLQSNALYHITVQARSLILEWGGSLFSVGGPRAMCAKSAVARGVWGHAPPGNFLNFRRSEIDSVAFWDTFLSW